MIRKAKNYEHEKLCGELLIAFGGRKDIRMWKRVVGYDAARKIKYGIVGESDLQGIIYPAGRMLCIEVKTGKARLSAAQKKQKKIIERFGGIWITAYSVNQALLDFELTIKKKLTSFAAH